MCIRDSACAPLGAAVSAAALSYRSSRRRRCGGGVARRATRGRLFRLDRHAGASPQRDAYGAAPVRTSAEDAVAALELAAEAADAMYKTGKKGDERVDDAKTATQTAKIAAKAAELGYEAFFASPDPAQYKGNDDFCHGTALFVKRDGLLAGGHLVAVPWDHDGHVLCYDHDLGRVVGVEARLEAQRAASRPVVEPRGDLRRGGFGHLGRHSRSSFFRGRRVRGDSAAPTSVSSSQWTALGLWMRAVTAVVPKHARAETPRRTPRSTPSRARPVPSRI